MIKKIILFIIIMILLISGHTQPVATPRIIQFQY